jgi:alanine racemase
VAARAQARIDVGAIERNARALLARTAPGTHLCAVVKADGYGHGAVASARAALAGGASWLAVATADEAASLRAAQLVQPILVLGALDERRPLAGTISMDSLGVDLGPTTSVRAGDEVVLIGQRGRERVLAEDLARHHDTINYEIVCALGRRVERRYTGGGQDG